MLVYDTILLSHINHMYRMTMTRNKVASWYRTAVAATPVQVLGMHSNIKIIVSTLAQYLILKSIFY